MSAEAKMQAATKIMSIALLSAGLGVGVVWVQDKQHAFDAAKKSWMASIMPKPVKPTVMPVNYEPLKFNFQQPPTFNYTAPNTQIHIPVYRPVTIPHVPRR